ncbi:MAG: hypothetical protein V4535_03405, partial [Bacteroidota bacterium]
MKSNFTLSKNLCAFLLFNILSISMSFAQNVTIPLPTGGFSIDGDLQANTPTTGVGDWIPGPAGTGGSVFTINGTTLNATTSVRYTDQYSGSASADNTFAGGAKYNDNPNTQWSWVSAAAGGKEDINNVYLHLGNDPSNNHQWIIFASDRKTTTGTSYLDFEFFQNTFSANANGTFTSAGPHNGRTNGDILLSVEYTGGGSTATVRLYLWSNTAYVLQNSPTSGFGQVNTVNVTTITGGAFGLNQYTPYQFVEGAIDMTDLLNVTNNCSGGTFGNLLVKTKTSASASAGLSDFAGPFPIQLVLGTAEIIGGPFCKDAASAILSVIGVQGGTYSAPSGLIINATTGVIDLANSSTGTYTVTYSFTTGGCIKTVTKQVEIYSSPTITPAASATSVCYSPTAQTTPLTYSAVTNSPTTYSITWNASPSNTFAPVTNAALPLSPISISIPANTAAGTYTGTITVKNAAGCSSIPTTFTLTINAVALPTMTAPDAITVACGSLPTS